MREHRRPALPGSQLFESQPSASDPAELAAAGHRVADLLVRGAHSHDDRALIERVVHLADAEGLGVIAELWSRAPAESTPGALWRLYLLRTWVHREPDRAAREFAAGKAFAPVHEVLAGVVDPPGPSEVVVLVDTVIRGILGDHFDVTLDRAAAFAHIAGIGRAQLDHADADSGARLVDLAHHLRRAAELERQGTLH